MIMNTIEGHQMVYACVGYEVRLNRSKRNASCSCMEGSRECQGHVHQICGANRAAEEHHGEFESPRWKTRTYARIVESCDINHMWAVVHSWLSLAASLRYRCRRANRAKSTGLTLDCCGAKSPSCAASWITTSLCAVAASSSGKTSTW